MNGLSSKGEWSENLRKRVSGLIPLKKLVYLISPNKINKNFYSDLKKFVFTVM